MPGRSRWRRRSSSRAPSGSCRSSWEWLRCAEARARALLPALHAVQSRVGWISHGALDYLSQRLTVPPAEAFGVASFYAMFSTEPRPGEVIHACDDIACMTAGATELCADLEEAVGPAGAPAAATRGGSTWHRSPCLGLCERAPAVLVQGSGVQAGDVSYAPIATEQARNLVEGRAAHAEPRGSSAPQTSGDRSALRLLRRVGLVDPESLDDYRAHGGYEALRSAVALGPEAFTVEVPGKATTMTLDELREAGPLRGSE